MSSYPSTHHSRYSTHCPETFNRPLRDSRKNGSVASKDSDSKLSSDSSRGIITLGAKIRNIGTNRIKYCDSNSVILGPTPDPKLSHKDKYQCLLTEKEEQKQREDNGMRLVFKRSDSVEMESTRTDSPRVSSIFTNRLGSLKLSTDPTRTGMNSSFKTTMESILLEERERLDKLMKENLAEIAQLTRLLSEQKRTGQSKVRQLEVQMEMVKYTHQQMSVNYSLKLESLKKESSIKDSVISNLSKELRELQIINNQYFSDCQKLREDSQRLREESTGTEEVRARLAKLEKEYSEECEVVKRIREENSKLSEIILTLNSKLEKEIRKKCSCSSSLLGERNSARTLKIHKSLEKSGMNQCQSKPHSLVLSPLTVIRLDKREDTESRRQVIEQQKKSIKKLQENEKKLQKRLKNLETLLDECNEQMIKERVKVTNGGLKHRY